MPEVVTEMDDGHDGPASVYPTRADTRLLLAFADAGPGARVLEIGCGAGAVALAAAGGGARVVATDLNPHALRATAVHAAREGRRVDLVRTDLAHGLGRFDRVLCNPPYLPTPPAARDPDRWLNLALDGGPDGLGTTRRVLAELPEHLRPGGVAYIVFSTRQPEEARRRLATDWRTAGGTQGIGGTSRVGDEELMVWELRAADPTP